MSIQVEVEDQTRDSVIHNFVVIGEASAHVPEGIVSAHPGVAWKEMAAMRNVVVHQYFGVSNRVLWDTVVDNLPPLAQSLRRLLEEVKG